MKKAFLVIAASMISLAALGQDDRDKRADGLVIISRQRPIYFDGNYVYRHVNRHINQQIQRHMYRGYWRDPLDFSWMTEQRGRLRFQFHHGMRKMYIPTHRGQRHGRRFPKHS